MSLSISSSRAQVATRWTGGRFLALWSAVVAATLLATGALNVWVDPLGRLGRIAKPLGERGNQGQGLGPAQTGPVDGRKRHPLDGPVLVGAVEEDRVVYGQQTQGPVAP